MHVARYGKLREKSLTATGEIIFSFASPYYPDNMFSSEQNCWFVRKVSFIAFLLS